MQPMVHIWEGDPDFTSIEKDWNRMVKEEITGGKNGRTKR